MNQKFIGYPIELNLNQLEISTVNKIVNELVELSSTKNENKSFHQFLKNNFGETLFSIYFGKYNKKIWNRDLDKSP